MILEGFHTDILYILIADIFGDHNVSLYGAVSAYQLSLIFADTVGNAVNDSSHCSGHRLLVAGIHGRGSIYHGLCFFLKRIKFIAVFLRICLGLRACIAADTAAEFGFCFGIIIADSRTIVIYLAASVHNDYRIEHCTVTERIFAYIYHTGGNTNITQIPASGKAAFIKIPYSVAKYHFI